MTSLSQVHAHKSVSWLHKCSVDSEVGRATRVWLHIYTPLLGIQAVSSEGTISGEIFNLVNKLIPAIVACTGVALAVLVSKAAAECLEYKLVCEVF